MCECVCLSWCATCAISCRYGPKCSRVTLGRQNDGITSVSAKSNPHVLVKKSDSRLASRGSFSAAGRLTLELNTVHLSCSATTDGPSQRCRPSPAEPRGHKKGAGVRKKFQGLGEDGPSRRSQSLTSGLLRTDVGQRADGSPARRGQILLLVKDPVSASGRPRRGAVAGCHGIGTGLPGG